MEPSDNPIAAALGLTAPHSSAALPQHRPPRQRRVRPATDRDSDDYLMSPDEIEAEGGPAVATQYGWKCSNRYGWRDLITKVGKLNRIRRGRWRSWQEQRARGEVSP
jgi:hypothetical protein